MLGGKGGPGEGMGNGFLRSKADKRGMDGLIVFITEILPVSRREKVISIVVEEEVDRLRSPSMAGEYDHVARTWDVTIPDTG